MNKELELQLIKAKKLEYLANKYPNLQIQRGRFNTQYFVDPSVANKCDKWTTCRSCSCCNDAPNYLTCFLIDEETKEKIYYMNPKEYYIGWGDSYYEPLNDFIGIDEIKEKLSKDGISQDLINKIEEQLIERQNREDDEYI